MVKITLCALKMEKGFSKELQKGGGGGGGGGGAGRVVSLQCKVFPSNKKITFSSFIFWKIKSKNKSSMAT